MKEKGVSSVLSDSAESQTPASSELVDAVERLLAWSDDVIIGRWYVPHYANPGEVKADVRTVLAALTSSTPPEPVRVEATQND